MPQNNAPRAAVGAPVALMPAAGLPQPPSRPRPAVIAETGARPAEGSNPGLTRTRPLALSASGSTGVVAAASSPLAMVATTPRSPAMRWVEGPKAAEPRANEQRLVPPGNVRYTNTIPGQAPVAEAAQPLPAATTATGKADERLPSQQVRAEMAANSPPPVPEVTSKTKASEEARVAPPAPKVAAAEPAKLTPPAPVAPKAAPRSGWIIQLAAAESDAKAREILSNARAKGGTALTRAEPYTESVAKGSTTLWRARFAGFDEAGAQEACRSVKRAGFNCIAQKI